jgi:hypothetical protein
MDSSFFKKDTINFYYALKSTKQLDCNEYMQWTFFDSTHLFQEYIADLDNSPVTDINPENVYNYKIHFSDSISKISLYKNDMLFQRYKVIYIDRLTQLTSNVKYRSIGLVKIN